MKPVDDYFFRQKEPYQGIMLYVRAVIFKAVPNVTEKIAYGIPFYYLGKKPFCYLNVLKGTNFVDVAFVQGTLLEKDFEMLKDHQNRKQIRSLQIKKLEDFDEEAFVVLLKAAAEVLNKSKNAWNIQKKKEGDKPGF